MDWKEGITVVAAVATTISFLWLIIGAYHGGLGRRFDKLEDRLGKIEEDISELKIASRVNDRLWEERSRKLQGEKD